MLRFIGISAVFLLISAANGMGAGRPVQTSPPHLKEPIPYKMGSARGVRVQSVDGKYRVQGTNEFQLVLSPVEGGIWNFDEVRILGVLIRNTGPTELTIDLILRNEGATGWSNSALGRTIVKPGEAIPLGVALCRSTDYSGTHPAYLRMSGKPDGDFRHWHNLDPSRIKDLVISSSSTGAFAFELGQMFPLSKMKPELLGRFPILDAYGQYALREWPGKVHSDGDIRKGADIDLKLEKELSLSTGFTKFGGWRQGPRFEATGFFRMQRYAGRWWFVDPEGYLFWSYGADCIGIQYAGQTPTEREPRIFTELPAKDDAVFGRFHTRLDVEDNYKLLEDVPHYDFTRANLFIKYGGDWETKSIERDLARLQYCNLNTIGAWSDDAIAEARKVPYTAMIHYEYAFAAEKLPDPFDPETRAGLRRSIESYPVAFKDDPWCLGAFVNNELHWKNSAKEMISAIFGYTGEGTAVKKAFRDWLKAKYTTVDALNSAWDTSFSQWDDLLGVLSKEHLQAADKEDCSALATFFAEAFFKLVDEELARYSPNTLYLGCRFNAGCREVVAVAVKYCDVISTNVYWYIPNLAQFGAADAPVLISEFHFANVTGNNLGSGLRSAQDALQQGRLFRSFINDCVNHSHIVGAHWFQWRDQSAAGRYDGENYDVGFFDVADIPNEDLIRAAEECGRHLYDNIQ